MKTKKKTRGGTRQGSGAKPKYNVLFTKLTIKYRAFLIQNQNEN